MSAPSRFTNMAKKPKTPDNTIALNKKARHDYFIEQDFEAGLALEGWEVKSLREGRAQLKESYVIVRNGGKQETRFRSLRWKKLEKVRD